MNQYLKVIWAYLLIQIGGSGFIFSLLNQLSMPESTKIMLANFLLYFILIIVSVSFLKKDLKEAAKSIKFGYRFALNSCIGVVLLFATNLISQIILLNVTNGSIESINQQNAEWVLETHPLMMSMMSIFLAPMAEELVFRLSIMKLIPWHLLSIIVSSLCFGLVHVMAGDLIHFPAYAISGLVLAIAYARSNNIWYPIVIHIINNLIAVMIQFL